MSKAATLAAALLLLAAATRAQDVPPPRDPMQPFGRGVAGVGSVAAAPRFALTAVLISSARRVAIVNGKPYQHGEIVDGAEVVRIEPNAVLLRQHGADFVVPLGRPGTGRHSVSEGETAP